jgi:hypothetical protein
MVHVGTPFGQLPEYDWELPVVTDAPRGGIKAAGRLQRMRDHAETYSSKLHCRPCVHAGLRDIGRRWEPPPFPDDPGEQYQLLAIRDSGDYSAAESQAAKDRLVARYMSDSSTRLRVTEAARETAVALRERFQDSSDGAVVVRVVVHTYTNYDPRYDYDKCMFDWTNTVALPDGSFQDRDMSSVWRKQAWRRYGCFECMQVAERGVAPTWALLQSLVGGRPSPEFGSARKVERTEAMNRSIPRARDQSGAR